MKGDCRTTVLRPNAGTLFAKLEAKTVRKQPKVSGCGCNCWRKGDLAIGGQCANKEVLGVQRATREQELDPTSRSPI